MRPKTVFLAALLLFSCELGGISARDTSKKPAPASCSGDFGTSVHFETTPSAAARKALKEHKLVCVLHVSGLFENPDFT